MSSDDALKPVVKLPATVSLLAIVVASITPCAVVLACAPAAIAKAASPLVTVPASIALTQNDKPATAGARFNRFSKIAVTKLSVVPLPYSAVDSALVPKLSIKVLTAVLVL